MVSRKAMTRCRFRKNWAVQYRNTDPGRPVHKFKMRPTISNFLTLSRLRGAWLLTLALSSSAIATGAPPIAVVSAEVDPLVKASPYADKSVWSYHGKDPIPWATFKPLDFGSSKIVFNGEGVRNVGQVPAPGIHPRIFFSPEDLPGIRKRLKEDRGGQEAWKNILSFSHAIKLTYDENADYAKPDWANGSFISTKPRLRPTPSKASTCGVNMARSTSPGEMVHRISVSGL